MDRKTMCMCICVMIALGAVLNVVGQGLDQDRVIREQKEAAAKTSLTKSDIRVMRAAAWCKNLSYLMGAVALLLILCCQCCQGVTFDGHHASSGEY